MGGLPAEEHSSVINSKKKKILILRYWRELALVSKLALISAKCRNQVEAKMYVLFCEGGLR